MKNITTILVTLIFALSSCPIFSQAYADYIGAGHDQNITVTTSSSLSKAQGVNTINGQGMDAKRMEASRFLAQSTLGFDMDMVDELALSRENNFESWIDDQLQQAPTLLLPYVTSITQEIKTLWTQNGMDLEDFFGPWALHFNYAFWTANMTNSDLLRHRVALALSEILVISANSNLSDHGEGMADYYDILVQNAFGNYEDILNEVSLHPTMGFYLSHFNNQKTNEAANIHPDENYAREIMQLFSIGLYELNNDGSRKKNGSQDIPTYDNSDITELAKVFTGLSGGALGDDAYSDNIYFGIDLYQIDPTVQMKMYDNFHEQGKKEFLGGVVPAGGTGASDIKDAINIIFNHPNVGPFVTYRLIQRLVKSNPSPEYINRVANIFNSNENGERGNLGSVIKAILLDPEARECSYIGQDENGKLREPILRLSQVAKSMELDNPHGKYWNSGFEYSRSLKQHVLNAPSVFNFFTPDHAPVGEISDQSLVGPEFKIHDSSSSINYLNKVNQWFIWEALWWSWEGDIGIEETPSLVYDELLELADDPEALIHRMDILYTHGQLSDNTKNIMKEAMTGLMWDNINYDRVRLGLYIMMISPDYAIIK